MSYLIGLLGSVLSLGGWFGFHSAILLVIGTLLHIVETLIEWKRLYVNAKMLYLFLFAIGCIVALFLSIPWYVGGMLAIAIYGLIIGIASLLLSIHFFC